VNPSAEEKRALLKKAAECYVKAGWLNDACRVWEEMGEYEQAAPTHEQLGNWLQAAYCYEQMENWKKAADCYLKGEQAETAANIWLKAGDPLKAAWIWVDSLKQNYRTQGAMSQIVPQTATQAIEKELIIARWEANRGNKGESGKRLREQIEPIRQTLTPNQSHLYEWALKVAKVLKRVDLTALIYSTAYRAKMPNVCEQWEQWAIGRWGDATGVPTEEAADTDEFEVVTVNSRGEIIHREWQQARTEREGLGKGVEIEMVYIPGGTFIMGTPETEKDSDPSERPQHQVKVAPFYIGKYQVTQAQWGAVAKWAKIERDLDSDPSDFKGENRPVEQVSWEDAVEFCARLRQATGKEYRLPSEAEWEYACRGGTRTPFHYGETITSDLANYDARSYIYAEEAAGEYRRETTPVGSFPPNSFGIYDMHGNVLEWCADPWHDNYEGAPKDGSVWRENGNDNYSHVMRGGSWVVNSRVCRSGFRFYFVRRDVFSGHVGFRVCCGVGSTLNV